MLVHFEELSNANNLQLHRLPTVVIRAYADHEQRRIRNSIRKARDNHRTTVLLFIARHRNTVFWTIMGLTSSKSQFQATIGSSLVSLGYPVSSQTLDGSLFPNSQIALYRRTCISSRAKRLSHERKASKRSSRRAILPPPLLSRMYLISATQSYEFPLDIGPN
jgi:hypothetical protein